jgi:type II secretory pathway pseudopilin PulG
MKKALRGWRRLVDTTPAKWCRVPSNIMRTQSLIASPRSQSGISLIEFLVAATLGAVGLMALVGSTLAEQRAARENVQRGVALAAAEEFQSLLQSDESWADLYSRLRTLRDQASQAGGTEPRLADGRKAWTPQAYYSAYVSPPDLVDLRVLVDVPAAPLDIDPSGPEFLREDVTAAAFGLPSDLNGDGVVDGAARDADYAVLPVVVFMRWNDLNGNSRELRMSAWVQGDR